MSIRKERGNGAGGGAKGARSATGAAPHAVGGEKGRWSARRKMTVVLELLRGAELEATSRIKLHIYVANRERACSSIDLSSPTSHGVKVPLLTEYSKRLV